MSLISDALRKAQQEREEINRENQGMISGGNGAAPRPLWKSPLIVAAGVFLLIGVLGVWYTRPSQPAQMVSTVPLIASEPAVSQEAPVKTEAVTQAAVEMEAASQEESTPAPVKGVERTEPSAPKAATVETRKDPPAETTRAAKEPEKNENQVRAESGKPSMTPDDEVEITLRTAESPEDYVHLYQMLKRRSDPRAFDMVKRGLAVFPGHGILNQLALIGYVRNRDYQQALVHADLAIGLSPDDPALLTYRGLCFFHQKDYAGALADFNRSLALDPQATENIYYLALIYDSQRQYELAVRYYRMFLDRHPQERSFRHQDYILDRLSQLTRQVTGE